MLMYVMFRCTCEESNEDDNNFRGNHIKVHGFFFIYNNAGKIFQMLVIN